MKGDIPMIRLTSITLIALLVCSPIAARADVVLDWSAIAVSTVSQGQSPFTQARFMAITQLAVFEAVNAITGESTVRTWAPSERRRTHRRTPRRLPQRIQ